MFHVSLVVTRNPHFGRGSISTYTFVPGSINWHGFPMVGMGKSTLFRRGLYSQYKDFPLKVE